MPEYILVDTSVWIDHFRSGDAHLVQLLEKDFVACHPFILGELACSDLKNREEILSLISALPMAVVLEHWEVIPFVEDRNLKGLGVGYVDVHLLGAALISDMPLWTYDPALKSAAATLKIEYVP